ncbi:MAG: hypothetical protein GXP27_01355 [Planctomycetes bacterium]|nr:hypothetical protein [Planctomycetota bacterium]
MRGRTWWKTLLAVTVLLHVAIAATAADSAGQQESDHTSGKQVEQVIVVFKTHFDIGYTELAREVVERYRTTMIDKALDVCDATRELPPQHRFVWTLSGWPMTQILWPGQTAERRARIIQAIRDGRLVWHALPGTTHTESMDLEDIVRGLGFSTRLSRALDLPLPRDAKMTDVPSHCWILPTILKRAGVDFLHLGCQPSQYRSRRSQAFLVGRSGWFAAAYDVLDHLRQRPEAA